MTDKQRHKILDILEECILAEEKGVHCFLYYSPHVKQVNIQCCPGKWTEGINEDNIVSYSFYTHDEYPHRGRFDDNIEKARNIIDDAVKKHGREIE